MATFAYDDNGNKVQFARYDTSGVYNTKDLFPDNDEVKKLLKKKTKNINLQKIYGHHHSQELVRRIFHIFMLKVLERVAEGDVFIFPGKTGANISLKPYDDDYVKGTRQAGKFKEIDIIKSNFKIPYFAFDFGPKYNRKERRLYVPKYITTKAFRNAENRSLKWSYVRKTLSHDSIV
jgi:hypothetical protein